MEKVIYLEPDDEITGVIDKIKKANQDKVILVVPKAATILQSVVNLKILKQQAVRLGKAISIVTSDETGRNLASQIGLTVYRDIAKRPLSEEERAPSEAKPKPDEEPPKISEPPKEKPNLQPAAVKFEPLKDEKMAGIGPREVPSSRPAKSGSLKKLKLVLAALIIISLFFAAAAYFLLPRANVEVVLKAEKMDKTYELSAQKDAVVSEETNTLPAFIYSVEKEGNKDFVTTGTKEVGEKARGTITVTNETGTDQPLVASTRFVSPSGLVFRSNVAVTAPKAYLDAGGDKVNGSVNVAVTADASGEKYNIASSSFSIPGLASAIQSKVYGRSSAAMGGGSTRLIKVISEADAKRAQSELMAGLVNAGKEEASAQSNQEEEMAIDGSSAGTIVSENLSSNIGSEAEAFKYSLKAKINVMAVKKSDYYGLLVAKINQEIPEDKELLPGEIEKTTESKATSIDISAGKMVISSRVFAPIIAKMDENVVKNNLVKKTAQEATSYLKSFEEVSDAKVTLWPFFARKIPNSKRIFINKSYQL